MNLNICMLIHVNIFKIYTVCVCIYIYIVNIHSTHTYKQKLLFWMRLIVIFTAVSRDHKSKVTALVFIVTSICNLDWGRL